MEHIEQVITADTFMEHIWGWDSSVEVNVVWANTEILSLSYGENEWCDGIARQTNNMRELIGQMIQMAILDERDIVTETEDFNLSDAVYDTCMSFQSPALRRKLKLTIDVGPSIRYLGNEGSIRQVIAILMDNAIKYCDEEGQISVNLRSSRKRRSAKLTVSNTCSEIDTLDTKHMFDRFYRHNKARESSNSFGLGLSIAKSIMEQHKGNLICCKGTEKQILFIATFKK